MSLLPPSTNASYTGAPGAAWFLMLVAILSIVPGCIHYFLPDGGAGVIAGLDLSQGAVRIIAVFAWYGALQIPWGIAQLIVGWRYRPLVPLFIALMLLQQALSAYSGWFGKGSHGDHHPPEHYGSALFVVLGILFLILSLRPRKTA
tara:strand:+ start:7266 stop:7703 length:438 start_codon:yes stop_codon:yes gene_type:complete